ncbi:hypothetical protein R1flu_020819 [Riccia fluitans]|uniref:Uncharacterized protein n=1 Tax=Riccia fluitans TaxID=41844 RepID=A0ABD1ZP72_9MARC
MDAIVSPETRNYLDLLPDSTSDIGSLTIRQHSQKIFEAQVPTYRVPPCEPVIGSYLNNEDEFRDFNFNESSTMSLTDVVTAADFPPCCTVEIRQSANQRRNAATRELDSREKTLADRSLPCLEAVTRMMVRLGSPCVPPNVGVQFNRDTVDTQIRHSH